MESDHISVESPGQAWRRQVSSASAQGHAQGTSPFHQLSRQLVLQYEREVTALRTELSRLRGGGDRSAEDVLSEHGASLDLRQDLLPPFRGSTGGSSPRMPSKTSTATDRLRLSQRPLPTIQSEKDAVAYESGETVVHRCSQVANEGGEVPEDGDGGFELWPEWTFDADGPRKSASRASVFWKRAATRASIRAKRGVETSEFGDYDSGKAQGWGCSCRERPLPLHPGSRIRIGWDIGGMAMLVFDIVWLPLQVFALPKSLFSDVSGLLVLLFWTLDIPVSFLSGFYGPEGKPEMRLKRIAKRYLTSWFPFDVMIVGSDWLSTGLDLASVNTDGSGGMGLARMGKIMRIARILRSLRLLRLAKLRQLLYVIEERIQSEYISIIGGLVQQVAGLLALNHFFACLWWLVGTSSGSPNWAQRNDLLEDEVPILQRYLVSLHWSLTQFTPAGMEVVPINIAERGFNVVVLLFAMVVFSSFVSSITSAMTRLRTLKEGDATQAYLLKKYLRENSISADLSSRVVRYIDLVMERHRRTTDTNKVKYLTYLSGPLNLELQREVFAPSLTMHSYFVEYSNCSLAAMGHLCYKALGKLSLSRGDVLFYMAADAQQMFFPTSGTFFYRREPGLKSVRRVTVVQSGQAFSEAVLWMPWVHRGTMKALIESEVVALDSGKFREVTMAHPDVAFHAARYAGYFKDEMDEQVAQGKHVWDLPSELMYPDAASQDLGSTHLQELHGAEKMEAMMLMDTDSSSEDEEEEGAADQEALPPLPREQAVPTPWVALGGPSGYHGGVAVAPFDHVRV